MAAELRIGLLGPLSVTVAGGKVGPGGSLRRSLLALLALVASRPRRGGARRVAGRRDVGRFPAAVGDRRAADLRLDLAQGVRGAGVGPRIATVGAGYRLLREAGEAELQDFGRLAANAQRLNEEGRPAEARTAMQEALGLWRGPALADLTDRPFHATAVRPLEERRDRIVEDWAALVLRTGTDDDLAAVAAALDRLRAAQPWPERSTELLMWALFRQGRRHDALDLYDDCPGAPASSSRPGSGACFPGRAPDQASTPAAMTGFQSDRTAGSSSRGAGTGRRTGSGSAVTTSPQRAEPAPNAVADSAASGCH
jgi:hypothetical protein